MHKITVFGNTVSLFRTDSIIKGSTGFFQEILNKVIVLLSTDKVTYVLEKITNKHV